MIFEFEIDFRYDLRRSDFEIIGVGKGAYILRMPPCFHEINIRNIEFYDEQGSKLLPWLLPDLLNSFLGGGLTEEHHNRLVSAARVHAEQQATQMINRLSSDVETSAKQTLRAIGSSFGATNITFDFRPPSSSNMSVRIEEQAKAA